MSDGKVLITGFTAVARQGVGAEGPGDRRAMLAHLRDEIRRLERRAARREGHLPCGRPEVDGALPGGGFRRGGLTELAGGPASGKTAVALALLAALPPDALSAWVDGRGELYPPAAAALGVDLRRLLVVRPALGRPAGRSGEDPALAALWAGEALLASGAFAAVVMDVPLARQPRGAETIARRLQTAVEKGGAIGLWLAPPDSGASSVGLGTSRRTGRAGPDASLRLPGAARLELSVGGRVSSPILPQGGRSRGVDERRGRAAGA